MLAHLILTKKFPCEFTENCFAVFDESGCTILLMWYYLLYFFLWISLGYPLHWSVKDFWWNHTGVNIIQFYSISVSQHLFFYFKTWMLELQKIFLIVRFFIEIFCNKGLKAKFSCFFLCFFCLTCQKLECSRIRKIASFLTSPLEGPSMGFIPTSKVLYLKYIKLV